MDEVNINKYLGQFNPILIVPVLSAVFGAILVFVFGFKRPNEPRFQSSDSLKKSKRKANAVQSSTKQSNASSAKVSSAKKAGDASTSVAGKKGAVNEKASGTGSSNNNNISSNNNNIKKKTDEKKSENGSPAKKVANKKTGKDSTVGAATANKKSKVNKLNASDDKNEKPADFDDGGWFTVQSKSGKQKSKVDDSAVGAADANASPKAQQTKGNNKSVKTAKSSTAAVVAAAATAVPTPVDNASENLVVESSAVDQPTTTTIELTKEVVIETPIPNTIAEPAINDVIVEDVVTATATAAVPAAVPVVGSVVESTIAFDEMGDWTDAKPDRKRGNKKKTRKD